ncbi:hypothetical protein HFO39_14200 [Rhizobium leguminosarum]|uniref:hypothetical protein n=1 Tax=Rhizobium leguminosarum TaxID=384 RepID=UPI001C93FA1E|nr:hypothetical protein [Rhizobium leguminosarum]MBY5635921.1 hypothetical protein [Rhizobium leguminosarum]
MKTDHNLVQLCLRPRSHQDRAKFVMAIRSLREQSPSIDASIDPATGGAVIRAASEAELRLALDLIVRSRIDVEIGPLQVVHRMSVTNSVEIDYTHKKHIGAEGEFARVKLIVSPNEAGQGFRFDPNIIGNTVPDVYIPGVEKGVLSAIQSSEPADFTAVADIKVVLVDGAFHEIDSSASTFEIASRAAFLEVLRMTSLALFEPVMKVEVVAQEDHAAAIIEDLKSRNGRIQGQQGTRGDHVLIAGIVSLENMLDYENALDVIAPGHSKYTMQFDHYVQVSPEHPDPPFRPAAAMRLVSVDP